MYFLSSNIPYPSAFISAPAHLQLNFVIFFYSFFNFIYILSLGAFVLNSHLLFLLPLSVLIGLCGESLSLNLS